MEKLRYEKHINAPREKVWQVLWGDDTYREWTKSFSEGSHVVTDWQEGSKVLFLDGQGSGMVSQIEQKKENEYLLFRHLGEVRDGQEDTTSERVKSWAGSTENYTLTDDDGKTLLTMEMDIAPEMKDMFEKIWPTAMDKIKELSEKSQ